MTVVCYHRALVVVSVAVLCHCVIFGACAKAATITYTLDPAQSQLIGSGNVRNITLSAQTPNSLKGAIGGSLRAEWRGVGLTFLGGSSMVALSHPEGPFLPSQADTGSGSIIDNFAAEGRVFIATPLTAVVRDAIADATLGQVEFGGPVTNIQFAFVNGTVDYHDRVNSVFDWIDMAEIVPVFNASNGTLVRAVRDNVDTITLPVNIDLPFTVFEPDDSRLKLQGQLVATSPVLTIEPTTTTNIASTQHLASLIIEAGATARTTGGTLVTQALNIAGAPNAWTGKLDLTNTDAVVRSSAAGKAADFAKLYNQIKQGFNNGAWTGLGITSSTAAANANTDTGVTVADNALLGYSNFAGEPVTANSILLKYTYYGDIDQNGQVDADDLTVFASNFGRTSGATQVDGDIDFNGAINADDLTVFANNFQKGVGNPLSANGLQAVPEPRTIAFLAIATVTLVSIASRRRCSRSLSRNTRRCVPALP